MSHWRLITNKSTTKTINDFNNHNTIESKPIYADWWGQDWELSFIDDPIKTYSELRIEAYNKEGCSQIDIMQALIQKMFDNDNSEFDKIQSKRLEIKTRFPKNKV